MKHLLERDWVFIVGAPKCGTSSLHEWLDEHPEVGMSQPKETDFFNLFFQEPLEQHYLRRHFTHVTEERLLGEASPSYLTYPQVADRIRCFIPSARIVMLVRDPADRAFSHWWMERIYGNEPLSFRAAMRLNLKQLQTQPLEGQGRSERPFTESSRRGYLQNGLYARWLQMYRDTFGGEKVYLGLLHSLIQGPSPEFVRLTDFLGVSPRTAPLPRQNVADGPLSSWLKRRTNYYSKPSFAGWLVSILLPWLRRLGDRPPKLHESDRRRLIEYYRDSNRELERLTGLDLGHWSLPTRGSS